MSSSDGKLKRFGKFLILDHLVDGGMAKIYRSRILDEKSLANKIVAIKMIRPQYSKDESFKSMFMDEIKVTYGLLHPNIVQTYEYGYHEDQLYVVLEYCHGRNLKEYLDKLREKKFIFPVEISVYVITQVCLALHYAHTYKDQLSGAEANIIHRDISPHNIMLTFDGTVKVIDFGIAKAETNSEHTQAGTIKGKLSYLAPEYLDGQKLDPRYDEFAVGITLWEMLCSRKLFRAKNDLAVLKKIQECDVPLPSAINPNVPPELDAIVKKALSKNRNDRYDNLDQLNRALMKFLYSAYPDFNATDLSYFAQSLFSTEIKKDKEKLFRYGQVDVRPYLEELKYGVSSERPKPQGKGKEVVLDLDEESHDPIVPDIPKQDKTASKIALQLAEESKELVKNAPPKKEPPIQAAVPEVTYEEEDDEDEEEESKSNPFKLIVASLAVVAIVGYWKFSPKSEGDSGRIPSSEEIVSSEDSQEETGEEVDDLSQVEEPAQNVKLAPTVGTVTLKNFNKYLKSNKLYINGEFVTLSNLNRLEVPLDKDIHLRLTRPNKEHFIRKIHLTADTPRIDIDIEETAGAFFGYLVTTQKCIYGRLMFNLFDEPRVEELPLKRDLLFKVDGDNENPISTTYQITYYNSSNELEYTVPITFEHPDHVVDLCDIVK
jgi:eukaryotic-like serine/threonine-protein kinase